MSISSSAAAAFDRRTQNRGLKCFESDNIEVTETFVRGFLANLKGEKGHHVTGVDAYDYDEGVLRTHCNCKQFAKGKLCAHLWATLLAIDDRYSVPTRDELTVSPGESAARMVDQEMNQWRDQLAEIHQEARQRVYHSRNQVRSPLAKRREVWYVLDAETAYASGRIEIRFYVRDSRANGDWGKFKVLSVQRKNLPEFPNSVDREILDLLLGAETTSNPSTYSYWRTYNDPPKVSAVFLPESSHELLLPKMCNTGRFVWLPDADEPIEAAVPLTWSGNIPWQFRLRIDKVDQTLKMQGELFREEDTAALSDVVLMTAGGIVVFPKSIGLLDATDSFSWIAALRKQSEIVAPLSAANEFVQQVLSAPGECEVVLPEKYQWEVIEEPPRPKLTVLPDKGGNRLYANLAFVYGEHSVDFRSSVNNLLDTKKKKRWKRNRELEAKLLDTVRDYGFRGSENDDQGDLWFYRKDFAAKVQELTNKGWMVEAEGKQIRRAGGFSLSVASNINWFELEGEFQFEGQTATLPALLSAVRKGERFVKLGDGTHGMLPEEWLEKYASLAELGEAKGDALHFTQSQGALLDALLAAQENVSFDDQFDDFRERLRSFDGVQSVAEHEDFQGELRDYQREGLGWLHFLQEFQFGGCLADDMGLGKTIQVLSMLQRRLKSHESEERLPPVLVVVPRSLVFNWIDEANRFTPELKVLNFTGSDRKKHFEHFDKYDIIVTTYGNLRRDIVQLKDILFDYAILDEAQAIKNSASQAAKACRLLKANNRLAMTGTPIENHLGELWSLFEFLNPGMLGRSSTFSKLVKSGGDNKEGLKLLAKSLRPFLLRRTKEEVLKELPPKTEQTLTCEMGAKQRKQYNDLRDYYRKKLRSDVKKVGMNKAKIHVLEALLRLRQAACHPGLLGDEFHDAESAKMESLLEQISEVLDEGHKALVFSQFTSFLSLVRDQLDERGLRYEYLDGRTRNRRERVKAFQEDDECQLFLISLKAGGHGLNLTSADYVFILDPWWNPAAEAQAIDRTHRIGQTRPVFAYRLICRDTVEDKIVELQKKKRELADAIVAADNSVVADLTVDDLELLLS